MEKRLIRTGQAILILSIIWIAYFLERESTGLFLSLYAAAFLAFFIIYRSGPNLGETIRFSIIIRMGLLLSIPNLSNDFYRFIWDGRMSLMGFNPFLVLPNDFVGTELMEQVGQDANTLYEGQGSISPGNYTCYPPLNQLMFIFPAWLFPENIFMNVVLMRLALILADVGTIHFSRKILKRLGLPESNILLFALNPFIILELSGNLHFEGAMIFFLVLAIYLLMRNKFFPSALAMTLSVSIKLIPLIFLPLLMKKLGQRGVIYYSLFVILGTLLLFLPFLSEGLVTNFFSSIDLYFRKFEFNASIYYLVRWAGYQTYGWNIIQKAGPLLGLLVFILVLSLSIIPDNRKTSTLLTTMLISISFYYFLTTTIHPWYISLPLILSVFTNFRFTVVWSFTIMLSYSAYGNSTFTENLWLIGIEYGLVYGWFIYEIIALFRGKLNSITS